MQTFTLIHCQMNVASLCGDDQRSCVLLLLLLLLGGPGGWGLLVGSLDSAAQARGDMLVGNPVPVIGQWW